ncbi:MAG: YdcF family protein [Vicingaceae bacterium]
MKTRLKNLAKRIAYSISFLACVFVLLAFTEIPYWAYYSLASVEDVLNGKPKTIVIMGGDGMPSPSGLMRCYYGAEKALLFPEAKIIIALPSNEEDSSKQLHLMAHELVLKGVDTNRIQFAKKGFNTRSQAKEIEGILTNKSDNILIVSSPEHMYRCIASFRKLGFKSVGSNPAFEKPNSEKQLKDKLKGRDKRIKNLTLRYNLWSYMQYEIIVFREYMAISYYWIKGWI